MADTPRVLYIWSGGEAWGLSSGCVHCIAAEAALRLAGVPYAVERCTDEQQSPAGVLPYLEEGGADAEGVVWRNGKEALAPALASRQVCRRACALGGLPAGSDVHWAVVEAGLAPATAAAAFANEKAFREHTRPALLGRPSLLDAPQPALVAWHVGRKLRRSQLASAGPHARHPPTEAVEAAERAYGAFAAALRGTGRFLGGSEPAAADAVAYAHLAFHLHAPQCEDELRHKVTRHAELPPYVAAVRAVLERAPNAEALPALPPDSPRRAPNSRSRPTAQARPRQPTASELESRRRMWQFFYFAAGSFGVYALPQALSILFLLADIAYDEDEDDVYDQ